MVLSSDEEKKELQSTLKPYGTFETDIPENIKSHAKTNFGKNSLNSVMKAEDIWFKIQWKTRQIEDQEVKP